MNRNVLWLSRHTMTPEQATDLRHMVGAHTVLHQNVTFPAQGMEAATFIRTQAADAGCRLVAGVFPAHVVAALVEQCLRVGPEDDLYTPKGIMLLLPVSVPAPAREGEVRGGGFAHSHWERLVV